MYKNHNYIPTNFEVNALCKFNDFPRSLGISMIFFFPIKWHLFCYKVLCGGMQHFLTDLLFIFDG